MGTCRKRIWRSCWNISSRGDQENGKRRVLTPDKGSNDEHIHHYKRGRTSITGLLLQLREIIAGERREVVVTARLSRPYLFYFATRLRSAFSSFSSKMLLPSYGLPVKRSFFP